MCFACGWDGVGDGDGHTAWISVASKVGLNCQWLDNQAWRDRGLVEGHCCTSNITM